MLQFRADELAFEGVTRYAYRQALSGILPDKLARRTSKAEFSPLRVRGLDEMEKERLQAILQDSELARSGLIPVDWLQGLYAAYWNGAAGGRGPLWPIIVEVWLRSNTATIDHSN